MEASGAVLQQVTYIAVSGTDNRSLSRQSFFNCGSVAVGGGFRIRGAVRGVSACARPRMASEIMGSGFSDNGHLQYYQASTTRCGGKDKQKGSAVLTTKKKMKLLKGLTEGLSMFSNLGLALDPENRNLLDEVQGKINSDAAEVLLKQLQQLRADEKEIKRKRKQEKAKLKAGRMKTESSSSSSESSDSDCGEVVNMNSLRTCVAPAKVDELQLQLPVEENPIPTLPSEVQTSIQKTCEDHVVELGTRNDIGHSSNALSFKDESNLATTSPKRIEVCMGKKCERSGAAALLQEFEKVMGVEGAVVGCKCMGKCRSAPNVRVKNSASDELAELNDSVKVPANPLCIGVGLEDVATIVANFFGEWENHNNLGLPAPTNP
ncbi:hypothetical protein L6164_013785 [Bauhinia variegata]|uniref:Uncharacterized protein n=1 Tax=Bauhinia variegata TaxID=167791 RepID=A0ACB9NFU3_BAUVA|nr:hypothetical protein L6164_013785 [Bauhinia variegata]